MARSTARKRALNTLYEADEKNQDIASLLEERIAYPGAQTPLPEYAIEICRGIADHRKVVDRMLNRYSTKWKVGRMPVIDRNILRIGAWEILFNEEVPDGVAIDEAIALAKTMSDAESPSFIHGLLSAIAAHKDDVDSEGRLVSDAGEGTAESEQSQADRHNADGHGDADDSSTEGSDSESPSSDDWGDWDADLSDPADQSGPQDGGDHIAADGSTDPIAEPSADSTDKPSDDPSDESQG